MIKEETIENKDKTFFEELSERVQADEKLKVGRPKFEEDFQKRRNVTLSDRSVNIARKIGEGGVSKGIRIALDKYDDV